MKFKMTLCMALMAALAVVTGCKTIPDKETVGQRAYAAGLAAGYAASLIPKITPEVKTNTVVIVTLVERCVPEEGKTVKETWTPVINEAIQTLISKGKLTEEEAVLVRGATDLATSGIDFLLAKHPEWADDEVVINTAIKQACLGFRTGIGINPNNEEVTKLVEEIMDKETFLSLTAHKK